MPSLQVKTPAICLPIPLDTVKQHLRVDIDDDDILINAYQQAATDWVEGYTGVSLIKKTYVQRHDWFPLFDYRQQAYTDGAGRNPSYYNGLWWADSMKIKTLICPMVPGSSSITYINQNNQSTSLVAGTDYLEDPFSHPARLYPMPGNWWPWVQFNTPNAVAIQYDASYADETAIQAAITGGQTEIEARQAAVPGWAEAAILLLTAHLYEHRESVSELRLTEVPQGLISLIGMYQVHDWSPTRG